MKAQKLMLFTEIFYLALILVIPNAWGILVRNPYENPINLLFILILTGFINIATKYGVFSLGFRKYEIQKKDTLTMVLLVNLIIFPSHQLIILFLLSFPGLINHIIGLIFLPIFIRISGAFGEIYLYYYQFNINSQIETIGKKRIVGLSSLGILVAYIIEGLFFSTIAGIFFYPVILL